MNYDEILAFAIQLTDNERIKIARELLKSVPKVQPKKRQAKRQPRKKEALTAPKSKNSPTLEKILINGSTWVDEEYMNWKKAEKRMTPSNKLKRKG